MKNEIVRFTIPASATEKIQHRPELRKSILIESFVKCIGIESASRRRVEYNRI